MYWVINEHIYSKTCREDWEKINKDNGLLRFSTREAAQAFIDEQNKPKFEVGKVYSLTGTMALCVYTGNDQGYGLDDSGSWGDEIKMSFRKRWAEATPAEWQAALIKEAERQFPIGTNYRPVSGGDIKVVKHKFKIFLDGEAPEHYYITDGLGGCVYEYGKWAEIVEPAKEKTNYDYFHEWHMSNASQKAGYFIDWLDKNNLIITPKP